MKKFIAIISALLLIVSLASCGDKSSSSDDPDATEKPAITVRTIKTDAGTFDYAANTQGDYEITKFTPSSINVTEVELPASTPDGREIVGIGDSAFKAENALTSVSIPDSYLYISAYAFYDCDSLQTVNASANLERIERHAFYACDKLTTIAPLSSLKTIGANAFMNCKSLVELNLSAIESIADGAFAGCDELTTVTLSNSVKSISSLAFLQSPKVAYTEENGGKYLGTAENPHLVLVGAENLNITACTINDNTKIVADMALSNCTSLETVVLGAGVESINGSCFAGSPKVKYTVYEDANYLGTAENPYMVLISLVHIAKDTLKLHEDTRIIADSALEGAINLDTISYAKTIEDWNGIIKTSKWDNGYSITIHCSDGNLGEVGKN